MQMPYTTKDDLRSTPYRNELQVHESRVVRYHSSSGSTGSPTVMAYTQADLDLKRRTCSRRMPKWASAWASSNRW